MQQRRGRLRVCWSIVGLFWLVAVVIWSPTVTAAPVYGGHATVLNVIYPELWDPHMAGTLGPLAALSPCIIRSSSSIPANQAKSLAIWRRVGK